MLVTRWQAPKIPEKEQIQTWFEMEGLEPNEVVLEASEKHEDVRNPFDEVIMVAKGQLILDIAGNKLLLREGDKILIPSNTKHTKSVNNNEKCTYIKAHRAY